MPKGDITPQAYLVKWVMRGSEGSKISKMADTIYEQPHTINVDIKTVG